MTINMIIKQQKITLTFCSLLLLILYSGHLHANVTLNKMFTDHMVLQRDKPLHIYGSGTNGESVKVTFAGQSKSTTVVSGQWSVYLAAVTFNTTPQPLIVQGNNTLTLSDVLIGDVWLLGGQSNMHRGIAKYADLQPDKINNPLIRMVMLDFNPKQPAGPIDDVKLAYGATTWQPATFDAGGDAAKITKNISATGIYFALELQPVLGVPIGLIGAYRGNTRAECWTPKTTLESDPELQYYLDSYIPNDITKTSSWLYNAIIHPITPFSIKGVLWYQGESNGKAPFEHGILFPKMIKAWRAAFNQGDFPFIFAQLASYKPLPWDLTGGLAWAYNKMSQRNGLHQPNTGMITLYDVGEWQDIHPQDKPTVGYRFAMKVREMVYKENILGSGPIAAQLKYNTDKVTVHFSNTGTGLETRSVTMRENIKEPFTYLTMGSETVYGFEIAGADEVYHPANAVIKGTTVEVSHPLVTKPIAVRYAFHSFTLANMYNKEGFPVEQFYTDNFDWPQFIDGHKAHKAPVSENLVVKIYDIESQLTQKE